MLQSTIETIGISGFKSIKKLDNFRLNPLNIFIGANGVGKSNFISLFKMLSKIIDRELQEYVAVSGGADNLLHFGQKTTDSIEIRLMSQNNGYWCKLIPAEGDKLVFLGEDALFHNKQYPRPYAHSMGSGQKESVIYETAKRKAVAKHVLEAMQSWKVYHFHDTSESAKIKKMGDIHDNAYLRPDASNLATYLFLLKEKFSDYYRNIVETTRMVAPFFDDFVLRSSPLNRNKIQLEWKHKGSDAYFGSGAFSDGTLRFICIATLLLQPDANLPKTILLDEPELGLHPYAITLLASMLQSASMKTQIIVSTQSVTLVNQFKPEDIIVADRDDGQSNFRRLDENEIKTWLDDYGLGDLWEKNIFGGRP